MTQTKGDRPGLGVVLDFEDSDFNIVSDFGFRYSDFQFTHHSELLKQNCQKPTHNF